MAMTMVLRRMGLGDLTVHGFRSTFRDWAGETTAHAREVVEAALAHRLGDKAEQAYARGDRSRNAAGSCRIGLSFARPPALRWFARLEGEPWVTTGLFPAVRVELRSSPDVLCWLRDSVNGPSNALPWMKRL
jgi:hypothetical protein